MIDKAMSVKREKLGPTFGRLGDETMLSVARSPPIWSCLICVSFGSALSEHFLRKSHGVRDRDKAGIQQANPQRKRPRPGWRGLLFCSLLWRSAWIRRGFAERELVPRDPTVKPCSDAFVPLDHDVFRSGRPKNMNVIDSKKLRRRMRAENRTHFSSSRSRAIPGKERSFKGLDGNGGGVFDALQGEVRRRVRHCLVGEDAAHQQALVVGHIGNEDP
jgi:hypothetical protein